MNVEAVNSNAFEVLELGSDQGVAGVGALSWLGEVSPSPDVGAVGWLEPDLAAKVFLWLLNDFFESIGRVSEGFGV